MPDPRSSAEMMATLQGLAESAGGTIQVPDASTVSGRVDAIVSKWFLGGRTVVYRFRCHLDEARHEVHFRESATDSSWGLPLPTVTVTTHSQSGTQVTATRTDATPAGGGRLEYGRLRDAMASATEAAGWTFVSEPGRAP